MAAIFRYCLHRNFDGDEALVAIPDAHDFLMKQALIHWRALPLSRRMTAAGVELALEQAFADVEQALRNASLRT